MDRFVYDIHPDDLEVIAEDLRNETGEDPSLLAVLEAMSELTLPIDAENRPKPR